MYDRKGERIALIQYKIRCLHATTLRFFFFFIHFKCMVSLPRRKLSGGWNTRFKCLLWECFIVYTWIHTYTHTPTHQFSRWEWVVRMREKIVKKRSMNDQSSQQAQQGEWIREYRKKSSELKQRISHQPPRHDHSVCNIERVPQSESSRMWNNSIVTSRIYLHYTFIFFSRRSVLCISHSFFCVRCCLKTIFLTIFQLAIYKYMYTQLKIKIKKKHKIHCMYFNDFNDTTTTTKNI